MIIIDPRQGSGELFPLFPEGTASLGHLDFADFMFVGNGQDGPVSVGVERKTIDDLVNSMVSGRLGAHQLPGLQSNYNHVMVLVEGVWRFNGLGQLEKRRGDIWLQMRRGSRSFTSNEIVGFLNTIQVIAGVQLVRSSSPRETVMYLLSLEHWWNKEWNRHRSHFMLHRGRKSSNSAVDLHPPTLVRKVAAELPLIGWEKSRAVADHFNSVADMIMATEQEWKKVPGIGKTIARQVVKEVWGT